MAPVCANISQEKIKFRTRKVQIMILRLSKLAILLVVILFISACSNNINEDENGVHVYTPIQQAPSDAPIEPLSRWLPVETFDSLIWGEYIVESSSYTQILGLASLNQNIIEDFLKDMEFETIPVDDKEEEFSVLPLRIKTGPRNVDHWFDVNLRKLGYSLIIYQVYSNTLQETVYLGNPYKVEGNKIVIFPDWTHEYIDTDVNDDNYTGNYDADITINTEKTIEIEFSFEACNLILSRDGLSVKMIPRQFADEEPWIMLTHYANSQQDFNGILYMEHNILPLRVDGSQRLLDRETKICFTESRFASIDNPIDPVIELYDNGLMKVSWEEIKREKVLLPTEPGSFLIQYDQSSGRESNPTELWFRYIWCDSDGLILVDENGKYYLYQTHYRDHDKAKLTDSIEGISFDDLKDYEIESLIRVHTDVLGDLRKAFTNASIDIEIDPVTGRVTMDTSILFGVNEYELSDIGKSYLDSFLEVYASVMFSETYSRSIVEILVEGHTDSNGTHEYNQILSEQRADAVADYCFTKQPDLAQIMVTRGYSYDYPVLDADGNEDMAASRRVIFKFILMTGDN